MAVEDGYDVELDDAVFDAGVEGRGDGRWGGKAVDGGIGGVGAVVGGTDWVGAVWGGVG